MINKERKKLSNAATWQEKYSFKEEKQVKYDKNASKHRFPEKSSEKVNTRMCANKQFRKIRWDGGKRACVRK